MMRQSNWKILERWMDDKDQLPRLENRLGRRLV